MEAEKKETRQQLQGGTEKEEEEEEKTKQNVDGGVIRPPDGGWGWAVVAGSFLCNAIVDGIIFSFGLMLPQLAEDLLETRGRLAWAGSLLAGFYLIVGPVVSGLANLYGCRPVAIAGTLLASASFAVASLAPNIEFLCLAFGVGGVGFGFIYLPAVVTVGFYFERRRAFATGLAVCGSGAGTFAVAPLVQHLLGRYGWRGTLLVLAGLILHCALFGALFRPLGAGGDAKRGEEERGKPLLKVEKDRWEVQDGVVERVAVSLPELSFIMDKASVPESRDDSPPPSYSEVVGAGADALPFLSPPHFPTRRHSLRPMSDLERPFYRHDVLYSASLLQLSEFRSQPDILQYASSVAKIPECPRSILRETIGRMLDTSLLRSPTFLLLCVGGFLTLAGFFVPFVFLVDKAVQGGMTPDRAAFLLPAIGLTNTVGRIFSGWASDRLDALTINNVALVAGGVLTMMSPFTDSFPVLVCYGALFGFSIACFATLRSIILVDLLGLDKLTNAFGLLLLFQGLASIVGAPIAGMLYDATGTYDASFYIAGLLILASGLLGIPLRRMARWEKERNLRKQQRIELQDSKERGPVAQV